MSSRTPGGDVPGVYVFSVQSSSPVRDSGVRSGDRVVDINGVSVVGLTTREVTKVLRNTSGRERIVGLLEAWTGQGREKEGEEEESRDVDVETLTNASM